MRISLIAIFFLIIGVVASVLIIYLTPLQNLHIIEPATKDISPTEFQAAFLAHPDSYMFVDVRSGSEYEKGHALGAVNVPLPRFFDGYSQFPKKGKTIVLICAGGRESGVGYGYLEHHGYLNLRRIGGGTNEWIVENLPIVQGSSPR